MQKKKSSKTPLKETQNPSRYYNSVTNLKFLSTQAKNIIFQKLSSKKGTYYYYYYVGAKIS